ncbi:uncharacterized protein ATNIH1004_001842 [Aspergillus tanneri]|uniref:Uncharacterized protein n=1 Tax=Aspergillus tanneri TaxID=1220188 RepID=A0A5M9N6M2_9EURO|nr:uncharacterized protein ATNIH1004_001842 [Aspergillus tanneri]KAA8652933.1 hypothetical protein ATNIH1004_001842 [Aspergillus tanneri]
MPEAVPPTDPTLVQNLVYPVFLFTIYKESWGLPVRSGLARQWILSCQMQNLHA